MSSTWIIVIIVAVIILWVIYMFNRLVGLRNETKQGFSGIDVQLKRRADLIPNLVQTVKGYAAHERTTLESVTEARQATISAQGVKQTAEADGQTRQALGKLFAVAEAYPDLKASQNFLELQRELEDTEDKIAAARRYYNSVVRRFNTMIQAFPSSLVAKIGTFPLADFYEIADASDRNVVQVGFGAAGASETPGASQ